MPQIIPYMSPMGAGLQSASNTLETAQGLEMQKAANQRAQERHAELMQRAQLQRERDQAASQAAQWQAQYMGVRDAGPSLDPIQEVVQQLGPLGAGAGIGYAHAEIEAFKQKKRQEAMNILPGMDPRDAARFAEAINAEAVEESRYIMRDKVKQAWVQSAQDGLWGEGDEQSAQMVEGVVADLESGAMEPEQAAQVLQQRKIQLAREQTLAGLRDVNLKRGTEMANAFSGMLSDRQEAAIMMLNSLYSVNYRTMKPEAYMEQMQSILLRKDSDAVGRARTEAMSRAASGLMENQIFPGTEKFDKAMQAVSTYFGNAGGSYPGGFGPRPAGAPVTPGGMEQGPPPMQPGTLSPEQIQGFAQMKRDNVQSRDADYGARLQAIGMTPEMVNNLNPADVRALTAEMAIKPGGREEVQRQAEREEKTAQAESEARVAFRGLGEKAKKLKPKDVRELRAYAERLKVAQAFPGQQPEQTMEEFARERFGISEAEAWELVEHGTQNKVSPGEALLQMLGLEGSEAAPSGSRPKSRQRRR